MTDHTDKIYTFLQLEAALCIWEWFIEKINVLPDIWEATRSDEGAVFMRLHVTPALADVALAVHADIDGDLLMDNLGWSYDWDFIPWVCTQISEINITHNARREPVVTFVPTTNELVQRLRAHVATLEGKPAHVGNTVQHGANVLLIPPAPGNWQQED